MIPTSSENDSWNPIISFARFPSYVYVYDFLRSYIRGGAMALWFGQRIRSLGIAVLIPRPGSV